MMLIGVNLSQSKSFSRRNSFYIIIIASSLKKFSEELILEIIDIIQI